MNQAQIPKLREIIKKNPTLIWYTRDYDILDEEAIAEAVYNFGSWTDIQTLHQIIGIAEAKKLFTTLQEKPRTNLRPSVRNYFHLYYDRHSS